MPVVVTEAGPDNRVAAALIPLLLERAPEVRAISDGRSRAEDLRRMGVKVAQARLDDPDELTPVFADAHTVCHTLPSFWGRSEDLEERILGRADTIVRAAGKAGVRRLILLSSVGSDPASPNAYLRPCGLAEETVRGSGLEHVIVRATLLLGDDGAVDEVARPWLLFVAVPGSGRQRIAPVAVGDVARVLAAADDRAGSTRGTFAIGGPEVFAADELAARSHPRRLRVHLRSGSRLAARLGYPPHALELLGRDILPDAPDAAAEFGIRTTPLGEGSAGDRPD